MEISNPLVSILIPVYNREQLVRESIDSALGQSYRNIEIIVCDNCSTDNTYQVCLEFAKMDSRVRVLRNKANLGPVKNWIRCVEEAKGEFSKILFSDDLLAPNCIEEMLQQFRDPKIGFVCSQAIIGEQPFEGRVFYNFGSHSLYRSNKWLKILLSGSAPVSPGAMLFRTRDLQTDIKVSIPSSLPRPYEKNGAGPDLMISLLALEKYPFVRILNRPLVFFRAHPGSFTIENLNNAVSLGYQSTYAYFLYSRKHWLQWLLFSYKNWVEKKGVEEGQTLKSFLKAYEGMGNFIELFGFAVLKFLSITKMTLRLVKKVLTSAFRKQ